MDLNTFIAQRVEVGVALEPGAVGGLVPEAPWELHENAAQPNAIKADAVLPYTGFPLGSIDSVTVRIEYDDGESDAASYARADVLSP